MGIHGARVTGKLTNVAAGSAVEGDVEPEALRRSIELSATRYCPVSALLSKGVEIEHRYRVTLPDGSLRTGLVVVTGPDGARPG